LRKAAKVFDLLRREAQILQVFHRLPQSSKHGIVAVIRQPAERQFESSCVFLLTGLVVAGSHGQFVKIGEKSVHIGIRDTPTGRALLLFGRHSRLGRSSFLHITRCLNQIISRLAVNYIDAGLVLTLRQILVALLVYGDLFHPFTVV